MSILCSSYSGAFLFHIEQKLRSLLWSTRLALIYLLSSPLSSLPTIYSLLAVFQPHAFQCLLVTPSTCGPWSFCHSHHPHLEPSTPESQLLVLTSFPAVLSKNETLSFLILLLCCIFLQQINILIFSQKNYQYLI